MSHLARSRPPARSSFRRNTTPAQRWRQCTERGFGTIDLPNEPWGGGRSGRAGCEAAGCLAACWLDSPPPNPRERGGVGSPCSWASLCSERLKQNLRGLLALLGGAQRRCGPPTNGGEFDYTNSLMMKKLLNNVLTTTDRKGAKPGFVQDKKNYQKRPAKAHLR